METVFETCKISLFFAFLFAGKIERIGEVICGEITKEKRQYLLIVFLFWSIFVAKNWFWQCAWHLCFQLLSISRRFIFPMLTSKVFLLGNLLTSFSFVLHISWYINPFVSYNSLYLMQVIQIIEWLLVCSCC